MNVSDKFASLQRRPGRRRSTPASPTSPSLDLKQGRFHDQPVFAASERNAGFTPSESPSIDLTVPSPTFDLASISPALVQHGSPAPSPLTSQLASPATSQQQPIKREENIRPAAVAALAAWSSVGKSQATQSPETSKGSPSSNSQRDSLDVFKRPTSVAKEDGAAARATAFWAQYGSADDGAATKQTVANKKSRFNLLNPMSLLARRRSSQNTNKLDDDLLSVNSLHVPAIPDNISPSIRGTVVHDFSAPRLKRIQTDTPTRPVSGNSPAYPRRPSEYASPPPDFSAGTPSSLHSPMFREHFQEENRSVQPTNTSYLHSQSLQAPHTGDIPSFAKKLPLTLPTEEQQGESSTTLQQDGVSEAMANPKALQQPEVPPPPPPKENPESTFEVPVKSAIPKHMASTSSRFSFMGEQGSIAQEKLLENKHKPNPNKQPAKVRFSTDSVNDVDDFDDFDGYNDEDDGFDNDAVEIKNIDMPSSQLPLRSAPTSSYDNEFDDNADEDDFGTGDIEIRNIDQPTSQLKLSRTDDPFDEADSDGLQQPHMMLPLHMNGNRDSLQAFHFTPQSLTFSPTTTHYTTQSTPRDGEGLPIGMAESREGERGTLPHIRDSSDQFFNGLGIVTSEADMELPIKFDPGSNVNFDDFDMYVNDGEFDNDIVMEANGDFDEEALDDPTRIKDIPAENEQKYQAAAQQKPSSQLQSSMPSGSTSNAPHDMPKPLFMRAESPEAAFVQPPHAQDGLTELNLAAHHDALANALIKAAANGSINRSLSFGQQSEDETDSGYRISGPGISSQGSKYSNNMISAGLSDDDDGYGFDDDDFDDEAMIAAANAEALENDDDGFYGQEFGFYARAHGREIADMTNGGYFTSRGSNGVKRSHSGKNNFQEPSLTPITERSEWSTRNSVASLPLHTGIPGHAMSSPGIAQLLERDSPLAEDEMSVSNLMKMRAKAFGGSSSSINSLSERHLPQGSSPLAHVGGFRMYDNSASSPVAAMHKYLHIPESEDEDDFGNRGTLTQTTPMKSHGVPVRDTSNSSREQEIPSSPISRKGNHSRNSSGAESVSYARESDGRWVLERRRTGDAGELELIGREYLAGARI